MFRISLALTYVQSLLSVYTSRRETNLLAFDAALSLLRLLSTLRVWPHWFSGAGIAATLLLRPNLLD